MKDYYSILNIQEDATEQEIKRAYYTAMKEWHPDRNAHRGEEATARTKEIVEAYSVLSDIKERERYDNERRKTMAEEEEVYVDSRYNYTDLHDFFPKNFNPNMSDEEFKKFLLRESIRIFQEWNEERNRRYLLGDQLLKAVLQGNWKEVDQLIEQGADLDNRITANHCLEIGLSDSFLGYTALHIAIWQEPLNVSRIKKLIENGASVNAQTESGMTPLHLLLCRSPNPSLMELVELMVKKGAFPHFLSKKGNSPLHIAIEKKHFNEAIFLIENPSWTRNLFAWKENSNMRKNANGQSPLELAVQCLVIEKLSVKERNEYWRVTAALVKRGNEVEVTQACIEEINTAVVEWGLIVPEYMKDALETNRRLHDESIRNQLGCSLM